MVILVTYLGVGVTWVLVRWKSRGPPQVLGSTLNPKLLRVFFRVLGLSTLNPQTLKPQSPEL